ncbi:hypothetical protein [Azospirillum endophyticum]
MRTDCLADCADFHAFVERICSPALRALRLLKALETQRFRAI